MSQFLHDNAAADDDNKDTKTTAVYRVFSENSRAKMPINISILL